MSSTIRILSRRTYKCSVKQFSSVTAKPLLPKMDTFNCGFRTEQNNPINHTPSHYNKIYTVPKTVADIIYPLNAMAKLYQENIEFLRENAFLIRYPALELMTYLKTADYSRPINKYVLYGNNGSGKSKTLLHLLHYAYESKFIILYVNWPQKWFRFPKNVSHLDNGMIDLPDHAAEWLQLFKHQNNNLLEMLNLTLSKDYTWTTRDVSAKDSPIQDMIEFGITRHKYSSDVIQALIDELKLASTEGKCKTLIAIDGYNAFCSDFTAIKTIDRRIASPKQITLTKIFQSVFNNDWCNGAAIVTVDIKATKDARKSVLPLYLLGDEFKRLDPFIPVEVSEYTHDEFNTIIKYYQDRKFLNVITPTGKTEIEIISAKSPHEVFTICKAL